MDDGTVNIRHGSSRSPSGSDAGFFSGGFGGGGSSRKRRARRIAARQHAERQQAEAARQQQLAEQARHYHGTRAALDAQHQAGRSSLARDLNFELNDLRFSRELGARPDLADLRAADVQALHTLIERKQATQAGLLAQSKAFFGDDLLATGVEHYLQRLQQLQHGAVGAPQLWLDAYHGTQSLLTLNEALQLLGARLHDAQLRHANAVQMRLRNLEYDAARKARDEQRAQDDREWKAARQATHAYNAIPQQRAIISLHQPITTLSLQPGHAQVMSRTGAVSAPEAASALYQQITRTVEELARIAAIRGGQLAGSFVGLMTYSPPLGNGELTAAQRQRAFDVVAVPLAALAPGHLPLDQAPQLAVPYRLGSEWEGEHRNLYLTVPAADDPSRVAIRDAVYNPLANTWTVESPGFPARHLIIAAQPAMALVAPLEQAILAEPIVHGFDASATPFVFNDFIARFPSDSGIAPLYLALGTPSAQYGVVTGAGQPLELKTSELSARAVTALPSGVADQLRWQSFDSAREFEAAVWKAMANQDMHWNGFKDLNTRRMQKGFAPLVPHERWLGERRALEIQPVERGAQSSGPYDLDKLQVVAPTHANAHLRSAAQRLHAVADSPVAAEFARARSLESARRRAAEQARAIAEREQSRQQAAALANSYSSTLGDWRAGPGFTHQGEIGISTDGAARLRTALSLAIAQTLEDPDSISALVASLDFDSAPSAENARFSFHLPVSALAPGLHPGDLNGVYEATLPVRLGSVVVANQVGVLATSTSLAELNPKVRIRTVAFDAGTSTYHISTDDVPPITLTWTPAAAPGAGLSSGSELPIAPERITTYSGGSTTALEAQIETLPIIDELEIDDYIYIFPADSGIEPQYVMFQRRAGPRYEPGVATGYGEEVTGIWLGEAARTTGAPIPAQIADQLRGRTFRNFDHFRGVFWKAVGADEGLSQQFSGRNLQAMLLKGNAPHAQDSQIVPGRERFEIHHVVPLKAEGSVYGIENLRVVTPKAHNTIHYRKKP